MVVSSAGLQPRATALARPRAIVQVNYRHILPSERAHHSKKPAIVRQKKKAGHGSPIPRQAGRLTVGCKLTSTSTSIFYCSVRTWHRCHVFIQQLRSSRHMQTNKWVGGIYEVSYSKGLRNDVMCYQVSFVTFSCTGLRHYATRLKVVRFPRGQ
jgi:hypothetical protein